MLQQGSVSYFMVIVPGAAMLRAEGMMRGLPHPKPLLLDGKERGEE